MIDLFAIYLIVLGLIGLTMAFFVVDRWILKYKYGFPKILILPIPLLLLGLIVFMVFEAFNLNGKKYEYLIAIAGFIIQMLYVKSVLQLSLKQAFAYCSYCIGCAIVLVPAAIILGLMLIEIVSFLQYLLGFETIT